MSLNRYNPKRDKNEPEIIEAFREEGFFVQPLSGRRVPDLLVGYSGYFFLVEGKSEKGTLTPDQEGFFDEAEEHNLPVYICRSAAQAKLRANIVRKYYANPIT